MSSERPADLDIVASPFQNLNDLDGLTHEFFVGRPGVWKSLKEKLILPKKPQHNIVWLSGPTGAGKTVVIKGLLRAAETYNNFLAIRLSASDTDPLGILWNAAESLKAKEHPLNKFARKYAELTGEPPKLDIDEKAAENLVDVTVSGFATFFGWAWLIPFQKMIVASVRVLPTIGIYAWKRLRNPAKVRKEKQQSNKQAYLTQVFIQNLNQITGSRSRGLFPWRKRRRRVFLIFDIFEKWRTDVSPWLLESLLKEIGNTQIVVVIPALQEIQTALPQALSKLPQPNVVLRIPLTYFEKEEITAFLNELEIHDEADINSIRELMGGSLLYLRNLQFLLVEQRVNNTERSIEENFLSMFNQQELEVLRAVALFSRPFTEDDLDALPCIQRVDRARFYTWLGELPCIVRRSNDGRYGYTGKARELFGDPERWPTRAAYDTTRRSLAEHYRKQLANRRKALGKKASESTEWLELVTALASQLFFLQERANHLAAVEELTFAYQQNPQTGRTILITLENLCQYVPPDPRSTPSYELIQDLMNFMNADLSNNEEGILAASNQLLGRLTATPLRGGRPGIASIYLKRGKIHLARKNYLLAIQDLDKAIDLDRLSAQAYTSRGEAYYQHHISKLAPHESSVILNELNLARDDLTKAAQLDPHSARTHMLLGRIYYRLGIYDRAINDFTEALKYDRTSPELFADRGLAYRQLTTLEGYQKAIADFDWAIAHKSDFAEAYADRGIAYRELKQFTRALLDFDKALNLKPDLAWARAHRGRTYRKMSQFQKAVKDLDRAITQNFKTYWVYFHRGIAHLGLGNLDLARNDFATSSTLQLTDTNSRWMEEWARMCQDARDDGMIDRLRFIAQIDPEQYAALVCTGVAYWLEDQFNPALEALEDAATQEPDEWDAPFWQGMACACLDKPPEALKMLEQARNSGLPRILNYPLFRLEEKNPIFFDRHVRPLLEKYKITRHN
ncbi:MAG TPA: tetratricopeptide repeat protein [Ktedonobacteraceae bacterium]|nr:tetratricopeptide repeat protein [Ktedonobacteraceae bacterium]